MADFQRLSQLDSGVLRANGIHTCLGAGVATVAAGPLADRTLQECLEGKASIRKITTLRDGSRESALC